MLKQIYSDNKILFLKYYFALILGMIESAVFPYYSGVLLDLIVKGSIALSISYLVIFITLTATLGAISYYYSGKYMAIIRESLNRECYLRHKDSNLEIMAAKMSQMDDVRGFFTFDIPDLIKISTSIIMVLMFLLFIDWHIAIIFIIDLIIASIILYFRTSDLREFAEKRAQVKETIVKSYSKGIKETYDSISEEKDVTISGYRIQVKTYFSLSSITLISTFVAILIISGKSYSSGVIASILLYLGRIDSILDSMTYVQLSIIRVLETLKKL
jgi:ABC-type bacteriocin/lantibiotic exporter with double-glycine peptidase domain